MHQAPHQPLLEHEKDGDDGRTCHHVVIELHKKFRHITGHAARLRKAGGEVVAAEEKQLKLLLEGQRLWETPPPEEEDHQTEQERKPPFQ